MGYMDNMQIPSIMPGSSPMTAAAGINPAAALGGLALEVGSAAYANRMANKRQHEAFDQQQYMMQNRYQMQTKDLMAAGLNPMLAVSQGAPMPGSVGQASTQKPDIGTMANVMMASAQAAKTRQETENLKLENQLTQQQVWQFPFAFDKLRAEIKELEQSVKTGKATEDEKRKLIELKETERKLGEQEYEMKRPEQIASGTQAAEFSARLERALKPLIDMFGGGAQSYRQIRGR